MKPSPTEIQRRRHRDLERCRDQRASLTAQRDALLAAAEAVMWGCKGCDWEKEHPSEPCEWKGHAQLRAAILAAKGGAE